MGASSSVPCMEGEEDISTLLTEKEWTTTIESYQRQHENTTVVPDLLYRFDGKTVSGPAGSDPLRCRKTGRFLQHCSFTHLIEAGGLLSLPLVDKQAARVRTGELAWLDRYTNKHTFLSLSYYFSNWLG